MVIVTTPGVRMMLGAPSDALRHGRIAASEISNDACHAHLGTVAYRVFRSHHARGARYPGSIVATFFSWNFHILFLSNQIRFGIIMLRVA